MWCRVDAKELLADPPERVAGDVQGEENRRADPPAVARVIRAPPRGQGSTRARTPPGSASASGRSRAAFTAGGPRSARSSRITSPRATYERAPQSIRQGADAVEG